jgi:hypothetical protein
MKLKLLSIFILLTIVLLYFFYNVQLKHRMSGFYSTKNIDSSYIEIKRPIYHFRHWLWSGIFPFYGGFINDPHVLPSKPALPSATLSNQYKIKRYQSYDINFFFKDETSEVVLAIEYHDDVYEYILDVPAGGRTLSGLVKGDTDFILFPYLKGIAIYTFMSMKNRSDESIAFYFIEKPFSDKKLHLSRFDLGSQKANKLIGHIGSSDESHLVGQLFCNHMYPQTKTMFENELGKCNEINGVSLD